MSKEHTTATKALFEIDDYIDHLVKRIELLNYINPLNVETEKEKFFASNCSVNPKFVYPKIDFDKFKLHREFFSQRIELIDDERIQQLYEDIIYFYSGLIQSIETINDKKFYYNSLHSFGTPTEKAVKNAKFILHFKDHKDAEHFKPKYTPEETEQKFRDFSKRYDFTYQIKFSDKMSAIAMVLNNTQTLVINKNHTFSENQIGVLTNHEIGVHMVTTMNALLQPLKIFSHGLPDNVETQEGLAVFSEYMSGNMTVKRLKELAYRVLAVDSLAKGYTFAQTFRMLHNTYDLNKESAYYITLRAHRGGGFTKDYLYLTGLKKIFDYHKAGKDLSSLLTGKVSLEQIDTINYLMTRGLAVPSKHYTDAFLENSNTNSTVDFILNNLK